MLSDDLVAKRGITAHRGAAKIGAREAEKILGVSRAVVLRLGKLGQLGAKLLDSRATGRRRYVFERKAVLELKERGTALRRPHRPYRNRTAWVHYFGAVPPGFTVISRDGNSANIEPENLALAPLSTLIRTRRYRLQRARCRRPQVHRWTALERSKIRREFPNRATTEIAAELGVSVLAVRNQANKMRLRKTLAHISSRAVHSRSKPIGYERLDTHGKNVGHIYVKVSNRGRQYERWRPKHHLVWEQANGKRVPRGFRVIFKDRDKTNFDPANLELTTQEAVGLQGFARFLSYPAPLQSAIRLTNKLQRQIAREKAGLPSKPRKSVHRRGQKLVRWTPAMDEVLCKEFPTAWTPDLARRMGVSVLSMRCRAKRIGLRKSPAAMIKNARAKAAREAAQALKQQRGRDAHDSRSA